MSTVSPSESSKPSRVARISAARLLAVQALYQMMSDPAQVLEAVIREYIDHRSGMAIDDEPMVPADQEHFSNIVRGVTQHQDQLQEIITANRGKATQEPLLNAIFLAGGYELMVLQSIDAPIIISNYVHVAEAFFDGKEPQLVNAVLDSIRQTVRD